MGNLVTAIVHAYSVASCINKYLIYQCHTKLNIDINDQIPFTDLFYKLIGSRDNFYYAYEYNNFFYWIFSLSIFICLKTMLFNSEQ